MQISTWMERLTHSESSSEITCCTPCFRSFFSFILWKGSATAWIISTTDIDYDNRKSVHRFRTKTDL